MFDSRSDLDDVLPPALFAATTPRHTLENTGLGPLVFIGVELKRSVVG